jgi:hypothetical protein
MNLPDPASGVEKKKKSMESRVNGKEAKAHKTPPMHDQQKQPTSRAHKSPSENHLESLVSFARKRATKRNEIGNPINTVPVSVSFPSSNHVTNAQSPRTKQTNK